MKRSWQGVAVAVAGVMAVGGVGMAQAYGVMPGGHVGADRTSSTSVDDATRAHRADRGIEHRCRGAQDTSLQMNCECMGW